MCDCKPGLSHSGAAGMHAAHHDCTLGSVLPIGTMPIKEGPGQVGHTPILSSPHTSMLICCSVSLWVEPVIAMVHGALMCLQCAKHVCGDLLPLIQP